MNRRLRGLSELGQKHEFFRTLLSVLEKFEALPRRRRLALLLTRIPYASDATNPQRHRSLRVEVRRNAQVGIELIQRFLNFLSGMPADGAAL